jgi:hypothetical protein
MHVLGSSNVRGPHGAMSVVLMVDIAYSTLEYQRYSFERSKLELSVHRIRLCPSSVCDKCLHALSSGILGQLILDLRCCEIENHKDHFPLIFLDVCVYTLVLWSEVREQSVYLSSSAVDSVIYEQALTQARYSFRKLSMFFQKLRTLSLSPSCFATFHSG